MNEQQTARGIGWASIGIGLTQLLAPRQLDRLLGTGEGENSGVFNVLGLREVMHGVDILSHRDPTPGLWSRVAGDALDIAMLGAAAKQSRRPVGLWTAIAMVAGIAALDWILAFRLTQQQRHPVRSALKYGVTSAARRVGMR